MCGEIVPICNDLFRTDLGNNLHFLSCFIEDIGDSHFGGFLKKKRPRMADEETDEVSTVC